MTPSPPPLPRNWPSDTAVLLELGDDPSRVENWWTVNHAFQGTQVFGATGSGKSSGSGRALARAFLESNFGGLVLTAKNDERYEWQKLAGECGRSEDLMIVSEDQPYRFNFLRYERSRGGKGADTENLVNLFSTVMESADRKNRGGEAFWARAVKQLLRNAIDLLTIADDSEDGRHFNLSNLYKIVTSAPNSLAETGNEEWQAESICYQLCIKAKARAGEIGRQNDFDITYQYWMREFAQLANDTKTAIVTMFTGMADCFLRGILTAAMKRGDTTRITRSTKFPLIASAANKYLATSCTAVLASLFTLIQSIPEVTVYRRDLLYRLLSVLRLHQQDTTLTIEKAALEFHRSMRNTGRPIRHNKIVATTLLVKGLEFDHVIVIEADTMTRRDLYVALTRGAKSVTIVTTLPSIGMV